MVTRVILTRLLEKKNQNFGLLACRIFGAPGGHCTTQRGKPFMASVQSVCAARNRGL